MEVPSPPSLVPPGASRRLWLVAAMGALVTLLVGGVVLVLTGHSGRARTPDAPTVLQAVREVARLETLDVNVYKKVGYAPEAVPTGNVWHDVLVWAKAALWPSRGRAIVFGTVHVGLDLAQLDAHALAIHGSTLEVVLPPLQTRAEVRPGETEILQSNLDSAQTAELLELARVAFEAEARADTDLQTRARASAERALRGLLLSLGFREVHFVPSLSGTG
jgi:hypothetical protein